MKSSNSAARLAAVTRSSPYMRPAKLRNSAPVSRPKSAMPSGTTPICRFTSTGLLLRSRPRISMLPELGACSPVSILIVVDLPAPLGPRKPKNWPGATRRFTLSTAIRSPKRRVRLWVVMVGAESIKHLNLAQPPVARCLLLVFGRTLLLCRLFHVLGPRRHNADKSRVGDRLTEVLGGVANDEEQNAAFGIFAAEPVQAFIQVGVGHGLNRLLRVRERIL